MADHLGSSSLGLDASGNKFSEVRYKPWGETRYSSGTIPTNYKYTGQREEPSIGLYFYNARWYDGALGRFIQADTIVAGGIQGLDRYAYANNDPMRYIDPTGHNWEECGDRNGYRCQIHMNHVARAKAQWAIKKSTGYIVRQEMAQEECTSLACAGMVTGGDTFGGSLNGDQWWTDSGSNVESWSLTHLLLYLLNNVGMGFNTPEFTFGTTEQPGFDYEFYYRVGLTTGNDKLVWYPFNKGIATPSAYCEDGSCGATYEIGPAEIAQDFDIKYEDGVLTVNSDEASRTKIGPISIYQYAGIKQSIDLRPPAILGGAAILNQIGQWIEQAVQDVPEIAPDIIP